MLKIQTAPSLVTLAKLDILVRGVVFKITADGSEDTGLPIVVNSVLLAHPGFMLVCARW